MAFPRHRVPSLSRCQAARQAARRSLATAVGRRSGAINDGARGNSPWEGDFCRAIGDCGCLESGNRVFVHRVRGLGGIPWTFSLIKNVSCVSRCFFIFYFISVSPSDRLSPPFPRHGVSSLAMAIVALVIANATMKIPHGHGIGCAARREPKEANRIRT